MANTDNADNVANRVREVRLLCSMTQEQLGKAVGLTRQSIIAIEKGRFTPSIHSALSLARALNSSVDELFWLMSDDRTGDNK